MLQLRHPIPFARLLLSYSEADFVSRFAFCFSRMQLGAALGVTLLVCACVCCSAASDAPLVAAAAPSCIVRTPHGLVDLSLIPRRSFVVHRTSINSSSLAVVQVSLCNRTSVVPPAAEHCNTTASYFGVWSTSGKCMSQFGYMVPPMYNASQRMLTMLYYNVASGESASVHIACGASDIEARGPLYVDGNHLQFFVASKYACPAPKATACVVPTPYGAVDLSLIPRRSFKVAQKSQNSSLPVVVQVSLCSPTSVVPPAAEHCNTSASYFGVWGASGKCMSQFGYMVPPMYNASQRMLTMLYYNVASGESASIYIACGASDIEAQGPLYVDGNHLRFFVASKYACPAPKPCVVETPSGVADLGRIPESSLEMFQEQNGRLSAFYFRFSLCEASIAPPSGFDFCGLKSYVGVWTLNHTCSAQYDRIIMPASYSNESVIITYGRLGLGTATVSLRCGLEDLSAGGRVFADSFGNAWIPLKSKHVCVGDS